ncbi:MerR family transcriptional regulator [Streptomyces sp. WMMC905]|uniref:MerR family transcriptional regulator n=1 Tax=Streptomyces sp. WMMC905 TaxID=3404123 RepID=UPI003B95B0D5
MRIGELAEVVGVTTRTVRHYHHLRLLPEPERLSNGYRTYTLRHMVVLARVRRLAELGLSLAEIRDVLSDEAGKDLLEVLRELDADLAGQEAAIQDRRARLRTLLLTEDLPEEGPVSAELREVFAALAPASDSGTAVYDREVLSVLDTTLAPEDRDLLMDMLRDSLSTPDAVERARRCYALLDGLADAEPDDPRVARAARALADLLPAGPVRESTGPAEAARPGRPEMASPDGAGGENGFLRAVLDDLAPAQAEAVRQAIGLGIGGLG